MSLAVVPGYLVTQMQKRIERIKGEFDSVTAEMAHLEQTAATLKQALQETDFKRDVTQRHLDNWQTRFESMRRELESAKELAEQAMSSGDASEGWRRIYDFPRSPGRWSPPGSMPARP